LIVSDNGRGFVVPERLGEFAHADHYGLLGMQERVAWVGGHMQILSQVPGGTVVTVVLPLQGEDHNETRTD
jgi:signal transduction histidine kinase